MIRVKDVIAAIEALAPRGLQESWDNTGLQVGNPDAPVTGVLAVVDVTPERVAEAVALGANMIVSHHPLIFKGLKSLTGATAVERAVTEAIRRGVAVYSSHTALDNAVAGVSARMAALLGATVVGPLVPTVPGAPTGTGVVAELPEAVSQADFVAMAKVAFNAPVARCTAPGLSGSNVRRVAFCGGAGGSFIADAVAARADAYVTGDIRYHDFVDHGRDILLVDLGHYETESLTRDIFYNTLTQAFPGLTVTKSKSEINSVNYI